MAPDDNPQVEAGNLFNVNGLVAVITGGGSGLGAMMARTLALNGAHKVFIIGRREDSLNQVASSISKKDIIIPLVGDVTSKDSLSQCVSTMKSKHDITAIDVLVANSGIGGPGVASVDPKTQKPVPFDEFVSNMWSPEPAEVNSTYSVNLTGVHFTVAAFLPLLHEANNRRPSPPTTENFKPRPQIITTGSIGGFSRKALGNFSYGPSKAGVIHMTKQLATFLINYDIRANVIAPGLYLSEMTQDMYRAQGREESHNVEGTFPKEQIPATRSGDEADIAGVILWLCSRAGAYINGNVVVTDGGRLSVVPASY